MQRGQGWLPKQCLWKQQRQSGQKRPQQNHIYNNEGQLFLCMKESYTLFLLSPSPSHHVLLIQHTLQSVFLHAGESAYMESAKCLRNQALFHIVGRSLLPFGWLISSCIYMIVHTCIYMYVYVILINPLAGVVSLLHRTHQR